MRSHRWVFLTSSLLLFGGSPVARGLGQDRDRGAQDRQEHKFSDQDRKAAQDYHNQHRGKPSTGFRAQDKLRPEDEGRIREGAVLDTDLRKRSHPIPGDLLHRLPPPARGHRYVVVGGQVCDVDSGWHISDVIHINLNL